ncbi:DUF305 domain-containing protein, partial [Micromonospora aurantiaca]|nr:DUF305 domain-containing protein [Micromonospora aurantiaca]
MTSRQARVWVGVTALVTLVVVGALTLTGRDDDARTPEAAGTVAVAEPSASAVASAPPVVVPGRPGE